MQLAICVLNISSTGNYEKFNGKNLFLSSLLDKPSRV